MADIFKPVITSIGYGPGNGLELFVSTDIYRYDVDNRPLENLAANDVALKDAIDEIVDEIEDAYDGKLWPDGTDYTWPNLDPRLDNMDNVLQNFTEVRNVQYSAFVQMANYLRERYTSGFMNGPYPDKFVRSNYAMENNEFMPAPFGGMYVPERGWSVKNQNVPDKIGRDQIAIETRIEPDGSSREYDSGKHYASRKPLYAIMNGYVVPIFNAHGGTMTEDQSIDNKCTSGNWGPIDINFPPAPTTGHRFDFAFLEMWLKEIDPDNGVFYPYGAVDWGGWDFPTLDQTAGSASDYSGTVDNREIVKFTESNTQPGWRWGFRVYVRDTDYDTNPIVWATEDPVTMVCEDNGSGALIEVNSSGCTGTIDYETGEWTLHFTTPPPNGKYIVGIYAWNAVTSANHWSLRGSLTFLPNGHYLQIQYRIRVVPGVDYASYPDWFSDPIVEARGPKNTPVANYTFTNMLNVLHDGTLWRAGTGTSGSVTDLGTYDGYIYALPLCVWSRFNQQPWDYDEQNGGLSDRLDDCIHYAPDDRHVIDLRPVIFSERYGMNEAAENTLDRIIRGDHRSVFGQAVVDAADDGTPTSINVWGVEVPELWRVYQYSGMAIDTNINTVRDIGLATTNDPLEGDGGEFTAPRAHHDGIRRIFSPQEEVQEVPISIPDVSLSPASPSPLVTYNPATDVITLSTNVTTLSGYSSTSGKGLLINDSYPRLWWRGSRQPVVYSTRWSGLGTNTATATIKTDADTYEPNGAIDGIVELIYPECTGIGRPVKTIDGVLAYDGLNNYATVIVGNEDGSPDDMEMVEWKINAGLQPGMNLPAGMCFSPGPSPTSIYVCDSANNRVVKLNASTLAYQAQWPTLANYPVPSDGTFDLSVHLRYPVDVACDSSGNVYVADRDTHRVVKLNSTLTTRISAFGNGLPATVYNDDDQLRYPEGVTVDSANNVYVADTELFRVVKLTNSLTYVSQIGNGYSGPGKNQFIQPAGLDCGTVDGDEFIYVADESRIVLVDPTNMTTETILGSLMGAQMQRFFRNQGWVTVAEDAAGNKYAVSCERKQVMKFDSGYQLVAVFGEDGVAGWDDEHLTHPRDLIYDANASLLYVADNDTEGDDGRVVVLSSLDLTYQGQRDTDKGLVGLAFYQDAGTAGKLYAGGQNTVYRFALPVPGSRLDPDNWTQDWAVTAFSGTDIAFVHDLSLNQASGNYLYVGDLLASKVYKVDISGGTPTLADTCDLISEGKAPQWPPAVGVGCPFGMELNADASKLYLCGGSLNGETTGGVIRVVNTSTMEITDDDLFDNQHWPTESFPFNIRFNKDGDAYVLLSNRVLLYNQPFVPSSGSIAGDFLYDVADVPLNIDLDLAVEWENVRAVHIKDDVLYVADMTTNTLTSIDAVSLTVLGQIGSPAVVGRGKASTAGPGGVIVHNTEIYFSDTLNNRVVKGYRFFPNVERGTGRLTYLIAPPATHTVTYQVRYAPYQGYWKFLNEPSLHGRHYITDNNTMYLTTLGRGTPSIVTQDGGMGFYANMIAHLPTPTDTPTKAPRVTDEYLFAPEPLPITGETGGTPFARLPVINRYPATAQEVNPMYGGGSRYDFTRMLFMQGLGPNWPSETPVDYVQRGFECTGTFPGYDTLETFPLQTISVPRLLFATAIVEIEGQGFLVIFTCYRAEQRNRLNDGTPIVADVFKLFGNPGVKARY